MLHIFGKPIVGHLCFKYSKMIILTNYALKTRFSKGLIYEDLWIYRLCKKCGHFKIQIARLVVIVENVMHTVKIFISASYWIYKYHSCATYSKGATSFGIIWPKVYFLF